MNPNRRFMVEVLNQGLDLEMMSAADVLAHVTPDVLAHHLPIALKAKLLQASLSAERMTPGLVVEVVGVEALVEHVPLPILWACVRACAGRQLQSGDAPAANLAVGTGTVPIAIPASTPTLGNGSGLPGVGPSMDDPSRAKAPRSLSLRPTGAPSRMSVLSQRSQSPRRDSTPPAFEARREESPDFEIVEETEVPARHRPGRLVSDDDTRPGSKP